MFDFLFDLLQKGGGLFILFLLLIIEGNPLFGFFIPGTIIVVFYGFFMSTQPSQSILLTLFVIALASILADLIGFYMGKKLGPNGLKRFGLDNNSILYKTSSKFFKNYGLFSIILGRQINFTRAFIPFFAGLSPIKTPTFIGVACLSGILWTLVTFMLGYYFGFVVVKKFEFFFGFLMFLLVYSLIIYFIYRFIKRIYSQNVVKIRRYAFLNILSILFLSLLSLTMLTLKTTNLPYWINSSLEFLVFSIGPLVFITSKVFMFFFFSIVFLSPLYLRKFKLFLIFIWSSFLYIQFTLVSMFFINLFFKVKLSFSIFMITYGIFLLLLLIYSVSNLRYKIKRFLILFMMSVLILFMLIYSINHGGDFYKIFISFIIATIGCEILYVLSHYKIVDVHICNSIKKG